MVDRFSGQFNEVNEYMTTNVEQIKKDAAPNRFGRREVISKMNEIVSKHNMSAEY